MTERRRFIDVWVVESNTVYREVPFAVVTDWIQQGRLLAEDRVRPSGTADWYPIGGSATFAAYVPKMEANRAEDQAEALERVELGFGWTRKPEDEDDDVDMIPLIDVSLVLLIFFMMAFGTAAGLFDIETPTAFRKNEEPAKDLLFWVGVDIRERKGGPVVRDKNQPWYSLGWKEDVLVQATLEPGKVINKLRDLVRNARGVVKIRLRAEKSLPIEVIKNITTSLKNLEYQENARRAKEDPGKGRIQLHILGEVSEPKKV